jgi:hypothetical protein
MARSHSTSKSPDPSPPERILEGHIAGVTAVAFSAAMVPAQPLAQVSGLLMEPAQFGRDLLPDAIECALEKPSVGDGCEEEERDL